MASASAELDAIKNCLGAQDLAMKVRRSFLNALNAGIEGGWEKLRVGAHWILTYPHDAVRQLGGGTGRTSLPSPGGNGGEMDSE